MWEPIVSTEKIDEYTVAVTTSTPYSAFLNVMAHGSALIPSPTAVAEDPDGYALHPVGTGPYKVEKFQPGTELVVTANTDYYEGVPEHQTITFRFVGDASARVFALMSGQADVIDKVPVEFTAELAGNPDIHLIAKPGLQVFGVGLNQRSELLQDKEVRQALNYAIDKEAIAKVLFMGYATPLTSPLAPNTTGATALTPYTYDKEKAEELLDKAGWLKGEDGIPK